MPDLLLELFCEEIPARMQRRAGDELVRLIGAGLEEAQLPSDSLTFKVTPRRLAIFGRDLPPAQPDRRVERKGPKVGAPEKAMGGFMRSLGLEIDQTDRLEQRESPKGTFYYWVEDQKGRPTAEVLREVLDKALASLVWPKSMRWGANELRWVRPLHRILALFDGEVLPLNLGHLKADRITQGHRFHANEAMEIADIDDYEAKLRKAKVMLDADERKEAILRQTSALAAAEGLRLIDTPTLLDEVVGLVEWPVVLLGKIDDAYMDIPPEVIVSALRVHQKYFCLEDPEGQLAPRFAVVANVEASDGGEKIRDGNERVLEARLADAKFFWDGDREATLESRLPRLEEIVFQAKLGEGADRLSHRVERLATLSAAIAERIGGDAILARRAARLAKADLVTGMVYELPELQGVMGRYYALHDGESEEVADAIKSHYAPQGPGDDVPVGPVAVAVAIAEKLDTLIGFFAIDEKPTGSKDPFALRRAALGILRCVLEAEYRLPLRGVFAEAAAAYPEPLRTKAEAVVEDLLRFFMDRLEVHLRGEGLRYDLIRAVFAAGGDDDLVRVVAKVRALQDFLASEAGSNLLAGVRRASNIVGKEEKKDKCDYRGQPPAEAFVEGAERDLSKALEAASAAISPALADERFDAAMEALAGLRAPIDRFFDDVMVNVDDADLRKNRLHLLACIRDALGEVADLAVIEA